MKTVMESSPHLVETAGLTKSDVERYIEFAEQFRSTPRHILRQRLPGALVATLFYEPSTRTRLSFEAAVTRLGGSAVSAENARDNSSAKKGETLADVFRVVGVYADAIIIRHHEAEELAQAVSYSPVPVINAGAGHGEHPTQSLLDVYTMWREFGRVDGLTITFMGDLKYGRTVHSLIKLLSVFDNVKVQLVHPESLGLPKEIEQFATSRGLHIRTEQNLTKALHETDVVYQTRIQRERLASVAEAEDAEAFVITGNHLKHMQQGARILHPLPRVNEISHEVDRDERAAYFRQAENGLYIRMALMDQLLGGMIR